MGTGSDMKALYIVINAGFTDEVMDIIRAAGSSGATIVHARGEGSQHKSFLGITIDHEQEIIISIVEKDKAERIMAEVKEKAGMKTDIRGLCYMMPIEKIIGLRQNEPGEGA
jgi:nitrogen regulatory protein PII